MSQHENYTASVDQDGTLAFEDEVKKFEAQTPVPLRRCDLEAIAPDTFDDGFLGPIVDEVSKSTETPIELGGCLGLATIATIAAKRFTVLVEPGYFEPLNVWVAPAMDPSNRKSAVLKTMAGPLYDWERGQRRAMAPKIEEAKSERKTQEKIISDMRKNVSKIPDADERKKAVEDIKTLECDLPDIPIVPQLLINDCTPEKVASLMQDQGERLAFLDSEADSLFAMMMGRYSDSPVLDVYLKSYSGDYVKVDRQTKEPISLHHPLLTLGIAPQPGLIMDLVKKPILVQRGLLSRFLFLLPISQVGSRSLEPRAVSDSARNEYDAWLTYLLTIPANLNDDGFEIPFTIKFSSAGYRCWKSWQREVEPMMKSDGRLADDALKYWAGKLAGNTARVAGLLHIAAAAPSHRPDEIEITETTVRRAVDAAKIMIDHSIAVHDLASTNPDRHRAIQIFDWLSRHRKHRITIRDLHQALRGRADFQSPDDVRTGSKVLIDHGWLFMDQAESRPGRPSEAVLIHPAMHTQNTQKSSTVENSGSFESFESFEDGSQAIENENLAESVSWEF